MDHFLVRGAKIDVELKMIDQTNQGAKGQALNEIGEIVNRGNQPLPLAGVGVGGGAWSLVGGFVLHGGVALSERDARSGPGLNLLLSLKIRINLYK